jgi:hypothetical protein
MACGRCETSGRSLLVAQRASQGRPRDVSGRAGATCTRHRAPWFSGASSSSFMSSTGPATPTVPTRRRARSPPAGHSPAARMPASRVRSGKGRGDLADAQARSPGHGENAVEACTCVICIGTSRAADDVTALSSGNAKYLTKCIRTLGIDIQYASAIVSSLDELSAVLLTASARARLSCARVAVVCKFGMTTLRRSPRRRAGAP